MNHSKLLEAKMTTQHKDSVAEFFRSRTPHYWPSGPFEAAFQKQDSNVLIFFFFVTGVPLHYCPVLVPHYPDYECVTGRGLLWWLTQAAHRYTSWEYWGMCGLHVASQEMALASQNLGTVLHAEHSWKSLLQVREAVLVVLLQMMWSTCSMEGTPLFDCFWVI